MLPEYINKSKDKNYLIAVQYNYLNVYLIMYKVAIEEDDAINKEYYRSKLKDTRRNLIRLGYFKEGTR